MQQEEILLDSKKFSFRIAGEGKTIVFLHGFGEDGAIWENQYQAFPGYQLVIPDLPGSGGSEMTPDMSMEGMADTISRFLKYINITTCIMIGHSMGGYVTLAFAARYPAMLSAFGLFHSTAFADTEEKKEIRKKGITFIEQNGAFAFLKTSIPGLFSPVTKEKAPGIIEEQIQVSHNFSRAALVSYYVSMIGRPDRTEVLKNCSLPVLFILGKYDTAVPLADGLRLCYLPDLSYIHILENTAHMGMKEEVILSNTILTKFLEITSHQAR